MTDRLKQPSLHAKMFQVVALLIITTLLGLGAYYLRHQPTAPIVSSQTSIIKTNPKFSLGTFTNCQVYPRSSMNIPPGDNTLEEKSVLECQVDGQLQSLVQVSDKTGSETAKNSIYRIWKDSQGYKALLVDQHGAGSGEGNGKIVVLENKTYKLIACFYYDPYVFSNNISDPLSEQEMATVKASSNSFSDPDCSNFILTNTISEITPR